MQYLASKKPGNSLWPADDRTRADITRWQLWRFGEWGKGAGHLIWERLVKKFIGAGEADPIKVKEGLELFNIGAAVLNGHLERRDYLVGTKPTLADFP
jgi:glutathione S-transferase